MADFSSLVAAAESGDASQISLDGVVLALNDSGKKSAPARAAALGAVEAIASSGKAFEPLVVPLLDTCLKLCADKDRDVQAAASKASMAIVQSMNGRALKSIIPVLLSAMNGANKFQSIVAAVQCVSFLSGSAKDDVAQSMTELVPAISLIMSDAKAQVRDASTQCMKDSTNTIDNKDIEPLIPVIVEAITNLEAVTECIHSLAATTFVQNVTSSALALVTPLLVRGLKEKKTATRRQASVIINNMSKLVEDPAEATPFLPQLIPELAKASEEVSDPEARSVCARAHEQLLRIQAAAEKNPLKVVDKARVVATMQGSLGAVPNGSNLAKALDHIAAVATGLVDVKCFDATVWTNEVMPYLMPFTAKAAQANKALFELCEKEYTPTVVEEEEEENAEELCNCKFTLAYGSKILLHNTDMKLMRGYRYGLLGGNDCGKTTLMRSIANGQVEGFPDPSVVRTVFVEADIQGEQSHLSCIDYIFYDPRIEKCGCTREEVSEVMKSVGFTDKMQNDGVTTLSGGWRMKLALSRAMLQKADILLLDEPTNHLDVMNVKWVMDYLISLTNVTSIMVSHDSKLLDIVCTHIMQIKDLKLTISKGNLSEFVKKNPDAKSFFELKSDKLKFTFPQPGFLEGVKSKGKPLMKMDNVTFTYPINDKPTITGITVRVSLASRVACIGPNGAGKSTMIKLLTGELTPQQGDVWKNPGCRVGYIAQHAFHHIENHLDKTPNEYIRWRYEGGDDKEALVKETMVMTKEEEEKIKKPINLPIYDRDGNLTMQKRVIEKLTGGRVEKKKMFEYECKFVGYTADANAMIPMDILVKHGFEKMVKSVDERIASRAGMYTRPVTQANVEKHLEDVGLDREYGTHHRIKALSGGQKVKVVLAASMWNQPHICILDEPTNYLDRESLGALAGAIREYEGGVVIISHNNQFVSELCPETWVLEKNPEDGIARLDCKGDPDWMESVMKEKVAEQKHVEEITDALGNTVKIKAPKKKLSNREKKKAAKLKEARRARGEEVSDDDDDWGEC